MSRILKIAICDDEEAAIAIISASVEALLASKGIPSELHKFISAKKCLEYFKSEAADLLFLDIAMPEADGIMLARKLMSLKTERKPEIIFVSNNQNRVFETFQVQPFGFVRKDNFMNDISNVLKRYVETKMTSKDTARQFEIHDASGVSLVRVSRIMYIESYRNTQTVHLHEGENIILHSTLDNIFSQVKDYDFIRIHKGYIVACAYIKNFGRNEIVLKSGEALPVGRVYYKEAMERYMTYIRVNGITGIG